MVLFNDFRRQWADTAHDTMAAAERVGASGWYILGEEVRRFEEELAALWPTPYATGVASGLDAIEMGLRLLGCAAGHKVLTTPLTAFATTLAIVRTGATPVFVDCDERGLINLDLCARALSSDTSIRYLVPVHLYGYVLDLTELRELRDRFSLAIVEDCAQSILASWNGTHTGTVGQVAVTSFYPTKNLGALGDGGALLTADSDLDRRARHLRDYGQTGKYQHDEIGFNSRLDELHAAILRSAHLPRLKHWTERRRAIAGFYLSEIRNDAIRIPSVPAECGSCWHLFPVFVAAEKRASFVQHLRSHQIASAEHYPIAVIDQKALLTVPHEVLGQCEKSRQPARTEVSLPIHPYLTDEEAGSVIRACNSWSAP